MTKPPVAGCPGGLRPGSLRSLPMPVSARRTLLKAGLGVAVCASPRSAFAQAPAAHTVSDGAGRKVSVPARVQRIFPAGPPAAIQIYTLAPDLLLGWPRANRPEELEFLLPGVGNRPELGRITGRGNTANLETVLSLKPDLIVDSGSTRADLRGARRARAATDRHLVRAARRPLRPDTCQLPPARRADRPCSSAPGSLPASPKRPWPRCAAAASPCPPSAARACTTRAARPVWRRAWPAPSTWRSSNFSV